MILAYCKYCKRKTIIFDKFPAKYLDKNSTETKKICFECENEIE